MKKRPPRRMTSAEIKKIYGIGKKRQLEIEAVIREVIAKRKECGKMGKLKSFLYSPDSHG